jgi:transposase
MVTPKGGAERKREELRRRGTLHPRPEQVSDPLFAGGDFFDPHDAIQVKYEMLRRVRVDDQPIAMVTRAFGFSRPTFYQAQQAFERAGLPGLLPGKPGPKGAHKLSGPVMTFLAEVLAQEPDLNAVELVARVRKRFDLRVHPRTIERALARSQKRGG